MQSRRRVPTIFSIYMVDVLCCALGCIVLLWQLYYTESEEQTAAARAALDNLNLTKLDLGNLEGKYRTLTGDLETSKKENFRLAQEMAALQKSLAQSEQLALVRKKEFDELRLTKEAADALIVALQGDLKKEQTKGKVSAEELAAKIKAHAGLLKDQATLMSKLAALDQRLLAAEKNLALKQAAVLAANLKIEDQSKVLEDAETRTKRLEKLLEDMKAQGKDQLTKLSLSENQLKLLQRELDKSRKDFSLADRRMKDFLLEEEALKNKVMVGVKELALAKLALANMEGERLKILDAARAIRTAAENRFAGIQLTGQHVLFLVDMSGSMELIDENLADPDKWPLVCETVAKILRSLPDLKSYQVIMFSDKIRYPLGREGRMISYDPVSSPKQTVDALKAVKPDGGTNMSAAFQEAFRFKDQGLDTIYVFSDGLPNLGDGLLGNAKQLTENQRTDLLSKHIRQKLRADWNPPNRLGRVRINTVGFFFESPDVGAFLWALARENDGSFVGMSRP